MTLERLLAGRPGALPYTGTEVPSLRFIQHQALDDRQEWTKAAATAAAAQFQSQSQLTPRRAYVLLLRVLGSKHGSHETAAGAHACPASHLVLNADFPDLRCSTRSCE